MTLTCLQGLPEEILQAVLSGNMPLAVLGDYLDDCGRPPDAAEVRRVANLCPAEYVLGTSRMEEAQQALAVEWPLESRRLQEALVVLTLALQTTLTALQTTLRMKAALRARGTGACTPQPASHDAGRL